MDLIMKYTVGVGRRFLPGFRRYKVTGHTTEPVGNIPRLVLTCADGSIVAIPGLDKRKVKVYPDYQDEVARVAALNHKLETLAKGAAQTEPSI